MIVLDGPKNGCFKDRWTDIERDQIPRAHNSHNFQQAIDTLTQKTFFAKFSEKVGSLLHANYFVKLCHTTQHVSEQNVKCTI